MFFQISPVRIEKKPKPVKKEDESEKVEVLSLAPFTPNPKLFFEDVKVGVTVSRKLLINNPTNHDVNLFISNNLPEDLNVTLNWVQTTIEKNTNAILELTWCPLREEASRHVITIEDGKKIRRDVPIAFKSISPKKLKTGTKVKAKPQTTSRKQTSPIKSSIKRPSPTKKYYSSRPSKISPKKYSPQKHHSPNLYKYSPSPKKYSPPIKCTLQRSLPSPKLQRERQSYYTESPKTNNRKMREPMYGKYTGDKENFPLSLLTKSVDNNVFVSPGSATFHMDYLQPSAQRRETYVVKGTKDKSPDSIFNDSLEASSPDVSPLIRKESFSPDERDSPGIFIKKPPLGISNRDNVSPSVYEFMQKKFSELPTNHTFQYKLQLDSFQFTPVSTPVKPTDDFSPPLSSTIKKIPSEKNSPETAAFVKLFAETNQTFEVQNSPNISTETYIKSNLSAETYVKGNASFETYIKGNLSGGTYTKDSSIGDVANLSVSPMSKVSVSPGVTRGTHDINQSCTTRTHSLTGDNAKNVIEANLWPSLRNQPLCSIKEESYIQQSMCENDDDTSHKSFLKRKSCFNISCTPSKRPNVTEKPKEWSKKGGAAVRIAKKSSGLNLKQFIRDNNIAESDKEATAVLTKKDTNTLIIQNPFLLAATNLVDPFMTSNLYINEEWLDQQQIDFKKWLNALLTPPEELTSNEQVVDVAKVWKECKKKEVEATPTKEVVSSKYHTNSKLNSLRKSAQNLFRTNEMSAVLSKVVLAVETGRLSIRDDKDIHLNLALKSEVMALLLSYNPLWLRIGLETIYNEIIPLKSNSDVMGLSTFIVNRLLKDPYLLKKHKVPHSPKYITEFKKFFLKKYLVLVYFLDQAKVKKLIPHDPCLFCKAAPMKESREMLIRLAREMLAAIGDITKYLKHIGYVVTHVQTYIHEFDYAVNCLGTDLRDGVRLTRLMEIILLQDNLTMNLRVPAISRLQKIHNMKIVFDSLEKAGYKILYDISPKDIVDGHKEKTLSFLWQIIYKFEAPLMVKSATTIQTWFRSLPVVLKRKKLERVRLERENAATKIQAWYKRQKLGEKLTVFASMLKEYLELMRARRAVVRIQSYYRMYRCRKIYTMQYKTVLNIQRLARGWLVRNVHRKRIEKSVILQSIIRMYLARKRYLMLKNATNVIQARYRAKKLMEKTRNEYNQLRTCVTFIQRRFLANRLSARERSSYQQLRSATICIQQRYRAIKLCRIQRQRYLEVRSAAVRIQIWYRSIRAMSVCRSQFITLKKAVIVVEQRYIALRAMKVQRSNYQTFRKACMTIQQRYRAQREMKMKRGEYVELRSASVILQRRYRAKKMMERKKQYFDTLKSHTVFVQRKFRANRAMKIARSKYTEVRAAAVKIQTWFRATMEMKKCHTQYLSLKYAVLIFEDRYKAKRLMQIQRSNYQRLKSATVVMQRRYRALVAMREKRTDYCRLKSASVFIQRKFRANKMAKEHRGRYLELKQAAIVIQNRYRAQKSMQESRKEFLVQKKAAVTIQRRFRANILMKEAKACYQNLLKYTVIVQRRFRANKAMAAERENYKKLRNAAVCIQQRWRAKKLGECQKNSYENLRNSALTIQQRWRANKLTQQERTQYVVLRKAVILIQSKWRAAKLGEKVRNGYVQLRNATVMSQRRWRAKKLGEEQRERYNKLKSAAVFVQRRWRANKLAKLERAKYVATKKATEFIQVKWRANKLATKTRYNYLQMKRAAVIFQQRWRAKKLAEQSRKEYVTLKNATVFIQRKWIANKLAKQERIKYEALKKAAGFLQAKWRANKLAIRERQNYLRLKNAANILQRRWRAKKLAEQYSKQYNTLKNVTVLIQRKWRANKLAKQEITKYKALREAVILVQNTWRAKKQGDKERCNYLRLKTAALILQRRWRARKLGKQQKEAYNALKKSAICIQSRWRANKLSKQESTRYQVLKKAVIFTQSKWRGKRERIRYLQLRNATVVLQQRLRANNLRREQRNRYDLLRKTTIFIQRKWRATILAKQEKRKYELIRKSTMIIQRKWRAETVRKDYLRLRIAVVVVQRKWRAKIACKQQKQHYDTLRKVTIYVQRKWRLKQLGKRDRNNYETLRRAAINIQRRWRAQKLMETTVEWYTCVKFAAIVIQRQFRTQMLMKRERRWYTKIRRSVILIQRFYRGYLMMKREQKEFETKRNAVLALQKHIRGFLVRRKYAGYFTPEAREQRKIERMEKAAATKIQAVWRGYRSRSTDTPELIKIRLRAKKANVKAEPHNTLGVRCKMALQTLVNDKSTLFVINKSLEDLDYITRHSKDTCAEVAPYLPEQIYLMIKHTNRSLPEMNACIFSVHILINLYKYRPTRHHSFIAEYMDNFITIMLHWCDKEAQVFPSMCTLLWLFAHNPNWRDCIKSVPNVEQRISKIQAQILRKESMVKRTGVKGQSLFVGYKNLPLPSLEPDWGLEYEHKPNVFTNSVHAIYSLLKILNL